MSNFDIYLKSNEDKPGILALTIFPAVDFVISSANTIVAKKFISESSTGLFLLKCFTKKTGDAKLLLNEKSRNSVMERLSSKLTAGMALEQTLHVASELLRHLLVYCQRQLGYRLLLYSLFLWPYLKRKGAVCAPLAAHVFS